MSAVFYENTADKGTVKSVYEHLDSLVDAVGTLKKEKINDFIVTSPLPRHDIEEVIYGHERSPVRWFTLTGALFGAFMGFALCSITHLNWAMIIPGGKPLVSIPAFIVIMFESTVLWGCLFTLLGMIGLTRLPGTNLQIEVQDPRFSDDKFGLVVNNLTRKQAAKVTQILKDNHAMQVLNGYDYAKEEPPPPTNEDLEALGFEEDKINTDMLWKLGIVVTVMVFASIVGVKMTFEYVVSQQLDDCGYSYNEAAVAPTYQVNARRTTKCNATGAE